MAKSTERLPSEFSATIGWGDKSSSSGTIQEVSPGLFEVLGSHTYGMGGFYPLMVQVFQGWGGMAAAAADPDGAQAQPLPQIQGPDVVLGFARTFDSPEGYRYLYTVTVPGLNLQNVKMTFNQQNIAKYRITATVPNPAQNTTTIYARVQFLNKPANLVMGLTYNLPGGPIQKVQPLDVWVVQLTIAGAPQPAIEKHTRYNTQNRGGSVIVSTRGAQDYSFDNLKKPDTSRRPNVDTELARGVVSFKVTVIMKGPGYKNLDGVNQVHLGWVQDVTRTTLKIIYQMGSAQFEPNPKVGPWLDSARDLPPYRVNPGTGGDTAFTRSSTEQKPQNAPGGGRTAVVVSLDGPAIGFLATNRGTNTAWTKTEGGLFFSNNLAAYLSAQPTVYSWIGAVPWSLSFIGSNVRGNWVNTGSTVNLQTTISQEATKPDYVSLPFVTGGEESLNGVGAFNPLAPTFKAATGGFVFTYSA